MADEIIQPVWTRDSVTGVKSESTPVISLPGSNAGSPGTGVTAYEYGNGYNQVTKLSLAVTNQAIAGGAALGVGNLIYTFKAGEVQVDAAYMSVAFTALDGNIDADTPEVGLGTVIASGAVAILSGTATFENIITGQVATDCSGTATVFSGVPTAAVPLKIATASAHTVYLNWADTWAASGEAAGSTITGDVILFWRWMG